MEMEVLSDLSTEKLTLLPGKFLSFCDSTLTPKDLLLRARKQQILLTDLITTSSAMGFDSCGGRDLFSPTKSSENSHCYGTQSTHFPWVGFGIPVSQTTPMVKQKIAYCLRSQQITNASWHLSDLATRLWTYLNCWPRGKITLCNLTDLQGSKGCSQSCKNKPCCKGIKWYLMAARKHQRWVVKDSCLLTLNCSIITFTKSKCDLSCALLSFSISAFHRSSSLWHLPFFFQALSISQNVSQSQSQFLCWDAAFLTCWLQLAAASWGLVSCWRANKKQIPAWGLGSAYIVNK